MKEFDYVVVGSGCAGAMAAQTLVEGGADVTMLDVGFKNPAYDTLVPNEDYLELRRQDPKQYKYLLGEDAEAVTLGEMGKGAQVTPPRYHMTKLTDKYLPLESTTFSPMESLGYGGLGIGWGLQCWEFSKVDLEHAGLDTARMSRAYETVSQRMGISATKDTAADYTIGSLKNYQPSAGMDRNHRLIYKKYAARQNDFKRRGFFMGRTPLALLTKDKGDRKAYQYNGMDYYADNDKSAWRPWVTVDSLRKKPNFKYMDSHLVTSFSEKDGLVTVNCINTTTNKAVAFKCRKLILAAGALGSARIVLRSTGKSGSRLPLLSNPHSYIPCIQPAMVGKGTEPHKLGLGQLSLFIDKDGTDSGLSVASTYSYQSLMLFRVINQIPLAFKDALPLMKYLVSGLVIMIAQHPDKPSNQKYLHLAQDKSSVTGDKLVAHYAPDPAELKVWNRHEKEYVKAMRKLNVYALKRINPGYGAGIHYAGTVPFSKTEEELTLSPKGRLHGFRNIYVADSSGFNYLPAKGLTFSLMANAHITAENALNHD